MLSNNSTKNQRNDGMTAIMSKIAPVLLACYAIFLVLLMLSEMGMPWLEDHIRASNQILLLLALLILPFVVVGMSRFIQTLTLKISGQELHVELSKHQEKMKTEVVQVEKDMVALVSTAEQALWPMLVGPNLDLPERLARKELIIGGKLDMSQRFMAAVLAGCIEQRLPDVRCSVRCPNGGTLKNFGDLRYGWIDIYVDFTGTSCGFFNLESRGHSDEAIISELNRLGSGIGVRWLEPLGASEDYCLVIRKDLAEERNITSLTQLKDMGATLRFSADPEFLNRDDCYLGLKRMGIEFASVTPCRIEQRYDLLRSRESDVFVGYETDPELYQGDIVRLTDPDQFFPRYMAIPVVHQAALDAIPGLETALCDLRHALTTKNLVDAVGELSKHHGHEAIAQKLATDFLKGLKLSAQNK